MTKADVQHAAGRRSQGDRGARLAFYVFTAVEAAALPLALVLGHYRWFFGDEWDFLAGRTGGDLGELFRPHNEHWSTLPILAYRGLWWLVGLRSYVPYQLLIVLLHLTAAALLRVVMRRAGVGPWIATAAASLFALLGAGGENIVWPFQIGFVGSLVFGLTHLLLADHEGPVDRRDVFGLLAGVAGLLCSGVAVTMVVVVGLAALIRRGWRIAALHTAPLGVLFLSWWITNARDAYAGPRPSTGQVARVVRTGIANAFEEMGQVPGAGIALGALLVAGLFFAWRPLTNAERRRCAAEPAAMLLGAVVFLLIVGLGRAGRFGPAHPGFIASGRYIHLVSALALPAIAVAANAIARRWRLVAPPVLALLVIGIPGNVKALADRANSSSIAGEDFQRGYRLQMLSVAHAPAARDVPRWVRPEPILAHDVTIGWLVDGVASRRVPDPGEIHPVVASSATLALALHQSRREGGAKPCQILSSPVTRRLEKGQHIDIDGGVLVVVYVPDRGSPSSPRQFKASKGRRLVALTGPLNLRLEPAGRSGVIFRSRSSQPVTLCG
jgi:hypothetical protein